MVNARHVLLLCGLLFGVLLSTVAFAQNHTNVTNGTGVNGTADTDDCDAITDLSQRVACRLDAGETDVVVESDICTTGACSAAYTAADRCFDELGEDENPTVLDRCLKEAAGFSAITAQEQAAIDDGPVMRYVAYLLRGLAITVQDDAGTALADDGDAASMIATLAEAQRIALSGGTVAEVSDALSTVRSDWEATS